MKSSLVLIVATVCMNVQAAYVQLQRIWATEPERIELAIKTYPGAFRDGFILSAFPETLKSGPRDVKCFATQKAFVERFRAQGVQDADLQRTVLPRIRKPGAQG